MSSLPASFSATLRALLARLIPADEFPGAVEAGGETYVLRQLSGDCAAEAPRLISGMASLDAEANARFPGKTFAALSPDEQDALLRDLESGGASTHRWSDGLSAIAFIARMIDLAHEGFYADTGNGGNRDSVSWRMIGYAPRLPVVGSPTGSTHSAGSELPRSPVSGNSCAGTSGDSK